MPSFSYRSRTRLINGVIGSSLSATTRCISSSRTIKLVADVSSSIRKRLVPDSMPSITLAACEVLPLASAVENEVVSLFPGRLWMKREISTLLMLLESSERSFAALASVMTYSRPSPAMWLYTPRSSACSRVDFPWKPPPTISVTPSGIPMPETGPRFGRSRVMRKDSGEINGTACFIGRSETPVSRGRMEPSAMKAVSPFSFNAARIACWSSQSRATLAHAFGSRAR